MTDDVDLAEELRRLRDYGRSRRYEHETSGVNSRLDEVQAAVLRVKLRYLDSWNERRRHLAELYTRILGSTEIKLPIDRDYTGPVHHLYVIRLKHREKLQQYLSKKGIQTHIHYPVPVHLQKIYQVLSYEKGDFPVTEKCAKEVLSLPIHPGLVDSDVEFVASTVRDFFTT